MQEVRSLLVSKTHTEYKRGSRKDKDKIPMIYLERIIICDLSTRLIDFIAG